MEELIQDLLNAQQKINSSLDEIKKISNQVDRIENKHQNVLKISEDLINKSTEQISNYKSLNSEYSNMISSKLDELVTTAFKKNKRTISLEIEAHTKTLIYIMVGTFVFSALAFWWIGNTALKEDIRLQRQQIERQQEEIEYMRKNANGVYKKFLEVKKPYSLEEATPSKN